MNRNSKAQHVVLGLMAMGASALILSGCSTKSMALKSYKGGSATLAKPVGIFTLRTENHYKSNHQAKVYMLTVEAEGSGAKTKFAAEDPSSKGKDHYEHLISVDLAAGNYRIGEIFGATGGFFVNGHFNFPVNARFNLPPNSITYLGHVTMVNRERKEGEPRSGGVLPLIDQAAAGYSGGTTDITITDRSEADLPAFMKAYPALQGVTINKAILQK